MNVAHAGGRDGRSRLGALAADRRVGRLCWLVTRQLILQTRLEDDSGAATCFACTKIRRNDIAGCNTVKSSWSRAKQVESCKETLQTVSWKAASSNLLNRILLAAAFKTGLHEL